MNNPINTLISKVEIEDILNFYGNMGDNGERLLIRNVELYQKAFVHESYYQSIPNMFRESPESLKIYTDFKPDSSNERLEFLGDHVLKSVLGKYLYDKFEGEREGFLTRMKIKIERCSMLHNFALKLGFRKWLMLSLQVENQTILDFNRGRNTPSFFEDAFEAFIGAIMLDFEEDGYKNATKFVTNIIENNIDFETLIANNDNFKDSLQRYFQGNKWKLPMYTTIIEDTSGFKKSFTRGIYISRKDIECLGDVVKSELESYNIRCIENYKFINNEVFENFMNKTENGYILIAEATSHKIALADQLVAKQALINLGLDLNY